MNRVAPFILAASAVLATVALTSCSTSTPATTSTVTANATVTSTVSATATQVVTHTRTVRLRPTVLRTIATRTHTMTVTYTPPPRPGFSDGTYLVGSDIRPGLYRTNGQGDLGSCYWERMADLNGGLDSIIANDNIDGPTVVQVSSSDRAFKTTGGCIWRRS